MELEELMLIIQGFLETEAFKQKYGVQDEGFAIRCINDFSNYLDETGYKIISK